MKWIKQPDGSYISGIWRVFRCGTTRWAVSREGKVVSSPGSFNGSKGFAEWLATEERRQFELEDAAAFRH